MYDVIHVRACTGLSGGDLLYFTKEDFELFGIDATSGENILENLRITLLERGVVVEDEITLAQTLTVKYIYVSQTETFRFLKRSFVWWYFSMKWFRSVLLGSASYVFSMSNYPYYLS